MGEYGLSADEWRGSAYKSRDDVTVGAGDVIGIDAARGEVVGGVGEVVLAGGLDVDVDEPCVGVEEGHSDAST